MESRKEKEDDDDDDDEEKKEKCWPYVCENNVGHTINIIPLVNLL